MENTYWYKQEISEPLFPGLLWSRPQNLAQAGKLLIIGGNSHSFVAPAFAYSESQKAGIGKVRVLLPDSLKKNVKMRSEDADFLPSTPSGSFGQKGLPEIINNINWADGVLLAGDIGHNSETTVLIEEIITKIDTPLVIANDAAEHCRLMPTTLKQKPACLVLTISQLQKLATAFRFDKAFSSEMGTVKLVDALHKFTNNFMPSIILQYQGSIFVAVKGRVSSTKLSNTIREITLAVHSCVWWTQNTNKPFEALTTAAYLQNHHKNQSQRP